MNCVTPPKKPGATETAADLEARARVATTLPRQLLAERFVYLVFAGVAAAGVIATFVWIVVNKGPGNLQVSMLTTSGGLITVTDTAS